LQALEIVSKRINVQSEITLSHKEPVISCLYNKQFKQLVSCSETGVSRIVYKYISNKESYF